VGDSIEFVKFVKINHVSIIPIKKQIHTRDYPKKNHKTTPVKRINVIKTSRTIVLSDGSTLGM
jgi:hypothetical protein